MLTAQRHTQRYCNCPQCRRQVEHESADDIQPRHHLRQQEHTRHDL